MTSNFKSIADKGSIKVVFGTAERPISAPRNRKQTETTITSPGPQTYQTVNTEVYKKRSSIIPKFAFTKELRLTKSADKLDCRSQSPGPNLYRPKSEALLRKSPSATIGNYIRFNFKKERLKSAETPGPGQYDIRNKKRSGP